MFIEKLKESDVEKLIEEIDDGKRYKFISAQFYDIGDFSKWFVRLEKIENQKEYSISFNDYGINATLLGFSQSGFKMAMYHMFGDEYKQAFNENLRKQYELEMIK